MFIFHDFIGFYILAQIEVKILLKENLFFVVFKKRLAEALLKANKKKFLNKRLKRKAGKSFQKVLRKHTSANVDYLSSNIGAHVAC